MVSVVGVGCNAFGARIDEDQTKAVVDAAIEQGITLFDTADSYGDGASEELLGRALGARRESVLVATKFGMGDHDAEHFGAHGGRRYIRRAVEASLRRLGTDYIDLYQLHRPDPITPIEETLDAMSDLVTEGKVRYLGSSNLSAWQVADADWVARTAGYHRFVSAQNEYSLYNRSAEDELLPACERFGIGVLPYFPLAYGLLTGKYRDGVPAGSRATVENYAFLKDGLTDPAKNAAVAQLAPVAADLGCTLAQLALAWAVRNPRVSTVITGASRVEQLQQNLGALAVVDKLTPEVLARIDAIAKPLAG